MNLMIIYFEMPNAAFEKLQN